MQLALKKSHHPICSWFETCSFSILQRIANCFIIHRKYSWGGTVTFTFCLTVYWQKKKHVMRGSGMKAVNACKSKAWWRWCSSHRHYLSNLSSPSSDEPGNDQMTYLTIIQPYNHSTEEPRPYQTLLQCMFKPMPCLDCFSCRFSLAWVPHWHRQPAHPLMTSLLCTSLKDHQDKPSPQTLPVQANHLFSFDLFAIWHMGNWGYS